MSEWIVDSIWALVALGLVVINGFFVAAEFALVKVRGTQLDKMVEEGRPFAATALWLSDRLDASLSACQLGITMASLALGWVGEPAFVGLLAPVFHAVGVTSEGVIHAASITIAFTLITALHLVIGEQAPKIFAIRRPDVLALWCAVPLKFFYVLSYPLLIALNSTTSVLLRRMGVDQEGHESPHSEAEIRELVHHAHTHGQLSRAEHSLIHGVFEFDDLNCRRVLVPRTDVVFFDRAQPIAECLELARRTKHTRYPVCDASLDKVVGVVHIKDLMLHPDPATADLESLMRPPRFVPETMPISKLLRHFQATHQLLAVVVDEHSTVTGIVTLENVLEPIIGSIEDEFDMETPDVVPAGPGEYLISGSAPIGSVQRVLEMDIEERDVDTFSGLLMARQGRILEAGDRVTLGHWTAHVLEVKGARAVQVRLTTESPSALPADKPS